MQAQAPCYEVSCLETWLLITSQWEGRRFQFSFAIIKQPSVVLDTLILFFLAPRQLKVG